MSYTLIGHFVDVKNKKVICSAELGFMKILNSMRYSNEFDDVIPTGKTKDSDYPEITQYTDCEFLGYFKKEFLDDTKFYGSYKEKTRNDIRSEVKSYVFLQGMYDGIKNEVKEYIVNLPFNEISSPDFNEKYILLYNSEIKASNGTWFGASDFKDVEEKLKSEYFSKKERVQKLNSLRDTKDWFEMSDDARNNVLEEIGYAEEDFEETGYKYESAVKINNILDFIQSDLGFRYINGDGETRYEWNYDDDREIEIYIEVD